MRNNFLEFGVLLVLIALSVVLLNPLHMWMPDMVHMAMLAGFLVIFAAFAAFVVREKARDEREVMLRMLSGRYGYLAGALVLVLAIAVEGLHGTPDPWLIFALLAMLVAKLGAHLRTDQSP